MALASRPRQTSSLVVGVLVVFLLGACGGGDGGETRLSGATSSSAPSSDLPRLQGLGETTEQGITYRYDLYIHCGMDQLGEFNGSAWFLTDAPSGTYETGSGQTPPDHWPMDGETLLGHLELVAPGRIQYSLPDGELIAVYEPADRPIEPCD